jgi:hypothetical protein
VLSAALRIVLVVAVAAGPACDEPCCVDDGGCADGLRCFEGICGLVCDSDATCLEGGACTAGVCRHAFNDGVCSFDEVD